jgi:uncharacterized RDD family membrane protein YckC
VKCFGDVKHLLLEVMTEDNENQTWAGQRLGLPADGPNSLAKTGRRVLALCIDWAACSLISAAFFKYDNLATIVIFLLEQWLLVATAQASFGHRLMGLKVIRIDGSAVSLYAAAVRAALVTLVVPALVWDSDNRGLHDKAVKTALVLR